MSTENVSSVAPVQSIVRRPYDGRLASGKVQNDASRWATHVTWTEASVLGPVYGYLILIADEYGFVNVLDLRHPDGESPGDVSDEEKWERTKVALERNHAKWWAYLPLSPPLNVNPKPWVFGDNGKPVALEADDDPPRSEWKYATNLPHEIVR